MTPATPSGRHHGGGPPQLPNSVGPGAADPVPDPVTGEAPAQAKPPKDANIRAIDRNEILPPGMATFAKDLAASRDPATVYRTLKGRHLYQPNFYLEAARVLFANRQPELARRVLSNIVEARPGNASALRSYAYWLAEFGQPAEAEAALRAVSANDPAAWQVTLDRASFQAARGDTAAATRSLTAFFTKLPACASSSLAAMALTELNAALPVNEMPHLPNLPHDSRINYRQNLAADIRIVVTSTGDDDALMLSVREPGALGYSNHSDTSIFGGRIATAPNVREYMIRRAVPGTYQIHCDSTRPTTIRAVIHTHWGRPNHTCKVVTMLLGNPAGLNLGEVMFEFQEPGANP